MNRIRIIKITALFSVLMMVYFMFKVVGNIQYRNYQLTTNSFTTFARIEKVVPKVRRKVIFQDDMVYFTFERNDSIYHKVKYLGVNGIQKLHIKKHTSYPITVSKDDDNVFEIDFTKSVQTIDYEP